MATHDGKTLAQTPVGTNEPQPCGLLKIPLELRVTILKDIFRDFLDHIDTIPFTRPTAGEMFQPRFNKTYNVAFCKRVFAVLHTSRRLRLDSFDVYLPLAMDFWQAVKAEERALREERRQRGDSAVLADNVSSERYYQHTLRAEGAGEIFLSLQQAEANSKSRI
jgi:hypothetical protein